MATVFSFGAHYAGNNAGASVFSGSLDVTAVVDDGDIAVGDQVTFGTMSAAMETTSGLTSGGTGFYLGTTTINGHVTYIFGAANTVGGNTEFLGVADSVAAANSTTSGAFATWAQSPTALTSTNACFAVGTQISTPDGACAVETLAIGDMITTASGDVVPVKWVGAQTFSTRFAALGRDLVRNSAGALGDGLPKIDLTLTADHGMILDGLVINASALVNGTTIDFVPMSDLPDSVTVYHIETEAHDVILANGAASETFLDSAGRAMFNNHAEYLGLYGVERIIPEMPAPRINAQRLLPETIKARLGINDKADLQSMIA